MFNIVLDCDFNSSARYQWPLLKASDKFNDRFLIIVPEQYTLQAEKDLLALLQWQGLFHIEVTSFKRVVQRILAQADGELPAPLSDLGKKMILSEIIDSMSDQLTYYAASSQISGTLDKLAELITKFRHHNVNAQMLASLAEGDSDSHLAVKLNELSLIYAAYSARQQAVHYDEDEQINRAIAHVNDYQNVQGATVIIEGFSSMTVNEQRLMIALASCAEQSFLRLIGRRSDEVVFRYVNDFIDHLEMQLTKAGLVYRLSTKTSCQSPWAESFKMIFDEGDSAAQIINCRETDDIDSEVKAVLTDMVTAYQNEGIAWRDMAVLTNDLAAYYTRFKRQAERFAVPIFTDSRRPALSHYVVDFILTTLRAVLGGYRAEQVVKVLKTGFIELPYRSICLIENYVSAHNIRGRLWLEEWLDYQVVQAEILPVITQLMDFGKALKQAATAKQKIACLRDYLRSLDALDKIEQQVGQRYQDGHYESADELAQVYTIIDHVLHQIYLLGEARHLSVRDFYELIRLGFESYEIGVIPQGQDYVIVGNIKRTRLAAVKKLYFLGMNEAVIPSVQSSGQLFNDDELHWLKRHGIDRLNTQDDDYYEEVYKVYEQIFKASHSVTWYRHRYTTEGVIIKPSLWFKRLAGNNPKQIRLTAADFGERRLARPLIEQSLNDMRAGAALSEALLAKLSYLMNQPGYQTAISGYLNGLSYTNQTEPLPERLARQVFGREQTSSISRLESFARCPYQHFISYALKPVKRQTAELAPIDIGNLYHALIENVMNQLSVIDKDHLTDAQWHAYLDSAYQAFSERHYQLNLSDKNRYFAGRLKQVVREGLAAIIEQDSLGHFKNIKNELVFADRPGSDFSAIELINDGNPLRIRGVIDRLDLAAYGGAHYLRIIDYKSSSAELDFSEVLHGLNLQLMLYMGVALDYVNQKLNCSVLPFGAFYFVLNEPRFDGDDCANYEQARLQHFKLTGLMIDDEQIHEALDESFAKDNCSSITCARRKLKGGLYVDKQIVSADHLQIAQRYAFAKAGALTAQIYRGQIAISPYRQGLHLACRYCQYGDICQFDVKKSHQHYRNLSRYTQADALMKMKGELDDAIDR